MKAVFESNKGSRIQLGQVKPYILEELDISTSVDLYDSKGVNQDGKTYLGNTLDTAEIGLQIAIVAETRDELDLLRKRINQVFNPKLGEGHLIYKNKRIKLITNKLPYFTPLTNKALTCLISLTAHNPYWRDLKEIKTEIAKWVGEFSFSLSIPEEGIRFGYREPRLIASVFNQGDVETGMRIRFRALGTVLNPSLFNVNTREFFKLDKEMSNGEVIEINTNFNNKKIDMYKNGEKTNAFRHIDFESTFLQLESGDNLFRYDAEDGLDNLEVDIYHNPQSVGV